MKMALTTNCMLDQLYLQMLNQQNHVLVNNTEQMHLRKPYKTITVSTCICLLSTMCPPCVRSCADVSLSNINPSIHPSFYYVSHFRAKFPYQVIYYFIPRMLTHVTQSVHKKTLEALHENMPMSSSLHQEVNTYELLMIVYEHFK